jgi:nitrous oxidase accessory protein NosD
MVLGVVSTAGHTEPVAGAGDGPCRVRNITRDTSGRSFERMIANARDGDRLRVRGTCASQVVIDKDLVIEGVGEATLDGERRGRVLRIRSGATVTLRNLVVTRGRPRNRLMQPSGGGIHNRGTLILVASRVTDNDRAYSGGGIYNGGTLVLRRSAVTGHGAGEPPIQGFGGGIYNTGTAYIRYSTVSSNVTDYEGSGI